MEKFKGTKAPWKIYKPHGVWNQGGLYQTAVCGNDKKNRNVANAFGKTEEESKANALLISKAPEMLEMLIKVNNSLLNDSSTMEQISLRLKIEDLIKEATEL